MLESFFRKKIILKLCEVSLTLMSSFLTLFGVLFVSYDDKTIIERIAQNASTSDYCIALLVLGICVGIILIGISVKSFIKSKPYLLESIIPMILQIVIITIGLSNDIIGFLSVMLVIFAILLLVAYLVGTILYNIYGPRETKRIDLNKNYLLTLIINIISIIALSSIFFVPLYTGYDNKKEVSFILINGIFGTKDIVQYISFVISFCVFIISVCSFLKTLKYYYWHSADFSKTAKQAAYLNFAVTIIYFVIGSTVVFYLGVNNDNYRDLNTYSWIPFLIISAITIIHSFVNSKNEYNENAEPKKTALNNVISLIFVCVFSVITFTTIFVPLLTVRGSSASYSSFEIFTCGIDFLTNPSKTSEGYMLVSFVFLAVVIITIILLVISIASFFTKSDEFKRIALTTIIINFAFVLILGLFGKYYELSTRINIDKLNELLSNYNGKEITIDLSNAEFSSGCFYLIIADLVAAIVLFFFKPFTKANKELAENVNFKADEAIKINIENPDNGIESLAPASTKEESTEPLSEETASAPEEVKALPSEIKEEKKNDDSILKDESPAILTFDACPSFSELDANIAVYKDLMSERRNHLFENPTLPAIVQFVVDYARESRLHLSYTPQTIAKFVAGLGATKLSILQGMSGTGKTSLPKIFMEALMGNCEIVEVESSWKDKNELIGYYNEFSKVFTPKKFTRMLYKASLNPDVITFIVLDEMNLSRIEYYFSDFLSLMENEPENREIQLCNIKLTNDYDNEHHHYYSLKDDHTLHIPENVWFIGTANRDESTFEISDKVYDRAATMNFNTRAPKVRNYTTPLAQRYLPYNEFLNLLENTISTVDFDLESISYIKNVEVLLSPYNISFGNRIMNQIEKYVKIYISCFTNSNELINEAVEDILLSKVVSKLEFKAVEDKEELAFEFEKLSLNKCAAFIRKLNEDF